MKGSKLRIGVAGLGFGARIHVPVLQSIPDVSVVALAGKNRQKVSRMAKKLGIPHACVGLEEFLHQELDAVSFALPPLENEQAVAMALRKGLPVLSEKPLAGSENAARKLLKAANGIPTMIDFEFMELKPFQALRKIIQEKKFGSIRHGELTWLVESRALKHRRWSWKTDAKEKGGVVSLLGSHFFFLIEWIIGPIDNINGQLSNRITKSFCPEGRIPAEDLVHLFLTIRGDIPFAAVIGNANPGWIGQRWEIVLDKGTLILYNPHHDQLSGFSLILRTETHEEILYTDPRRKGCDGNYLAFRSLALRFVEAIQEKKSTFPDFHTAVRIQSLMEKTYSLNHI